MHSLPTSWPWRWPRVLSRSRLPRSPMSHVRVVDSRPVWSGLSLGTGGIYKMNSGAQDAVQTGYTKRHGLSARRSLERATPCTWRGAASGFRYVLGKSRHSTWSSIGLVSNPSGSSSQSRRPPSASSCSSCVEHPAEAQDRPLGNACPSRAAALPAPPSRTSRAPTCRHGGSAGVRALGSASGLITIPYPWVASALLASPP